MSHDALRHWKEKAARLKIVVIGDLILDQYYTGLQTRFCREAPVPVFKVNTIENVGGGAANTAINIKALGAIPMLISVIGNDKNSAELINLLSQKEIDTEWMIVEENRSLVCKKRYLTHNTILFRADEGDTIPYSHETQERLIESIAYYWDKTEHIIICDYNTGLFTENIIDHIQELQEKNPRKIIVDAHHPERFARLKPFAAKPNYLESAQSLSLPLKENEERVDQLQKHQPLLHDVLGSNIICQTIDKNGVLLFRKGERTIHYRSRSVEAHHTIGAGDSFTAAFSISLAMGADPTKATETAHVAASIVLKKNKTAVCTAEELWSHLNQFPKYVTDLQAFEKTIQTQREAGKTIVFTNGCFDILHKGHIMFLDEAKKLGDILIVAVNSDNSIQQIKGENRPVNTLTDRIAVLSALENIDHILSFDHIHCTHLIYTLKPDIFVKGNTYINQSISESKAIEETGGKICILDSTSYSTSALLKRIQNKV